ncbi:hypothetical protein ACTXT7_016162 [Hymenolepis weldensis]
MHVCESEDVRSMRIDEHPLVRMKNSPGQLWSARETKEYEFFLRVAPGYLHSNPKADPETDHPFKTGNSCSACPEGFELCENEMCTSESQNPAEPDFQPDAFEKNEDSNGNEGYKEEEQNRDNNSDNNPYAAASGIGEQVLDHESSDSATQLTVPFVTSFTLLLLEGAAYSVIYHPRLIGKEISNARLDNRRDKTSSIISTSFLVWGPDTLDMILGLN